ncbi:hypothetical protein [Blastopirellula marina]|uniref:Outer membrane lipoprotein BamD-like domain-containing protein n=1 Tax=Blastopirellula marina TaxID=124 RepID=A0A2S8FWX2_9BACT|nr:hypothetical protein [Blastopirellula marina]PQO36682.1 hypothetical protein C5Y98_11865 [Blastopirellula marina]PTL44512.1 hypothetical protein C5Y97_11875 [Blastopirellula marina]
MEEYHRVDQYLSKLKLTDQRLILITRYLQRPMTPEQSNKLIETASRLYATQLMVYADDAARSKYYREQVEAFLGTHPQADTKELQVMMLQADYNRAESAASRWLNDPTDETSKQTAQEIFARIAPKLVEYHRALEKQVESEYKQIDRMMPGARRDELEQENKQLEGVVGRAAFFGAWSNYYLVLVEGLPTTAPQTKIAIDLFRQLLDLKEDPQATTAWHERADANRMGLQQEWRARALIGLAMAEILSDDLPDARRCFTLLKSGQTSPEIVDQSDYWYVRGLLNANKPDQAANIAKSIVQGYQGGTSPGKTSLCVLLADAGLREKETSPALYEMGVQGLVGLAKLGHHSAAIQLMEKYHIELEETPNFYMLWLIGQQKFAEAEKSMSDAEYRLAQAELTKALAAPEAKEDLASASECRYTLGWCSYRLGEYVEAGQNFQSAVVGLRGPNPNKAAEAAWMSFVAYQSLSKDQPQYGLRAIEVLEDLKRDFPEHPYAQKADYFIAKLQQSRGSMTSSIRQLQSIDASDTNFWSAKFDLCNLLRQKIDQAASEAEQKELARQLQDVVTDLQSRLQPASATPDQISGVVRCILNVADLGRKNLLDTSQFATSVAEAKELVEKLPKEDRAWVDYHYQALLLARQQKQEGDVTIHAQWLLDNAEGTPYEQTALIIRALEIDRLAAATKSPGKNLLSEGLAIYTRLLKHLGSTSGAIQQSKNAKVACSKAADFAEKLGKWPEAATYLRVLVEAFPTEQEYLQRLGRVEFQLDNYSAAVGYWRTLLVGLNKGSEDWFEAKYYQLACLQKIDRPQAKTVLQQFQLLHPDWGLPPWRDKIKAIAEQINGPGGS